MISKYYLDLPQLQELSSVGYSFMLYRQVFMKNIPLASHVSLTNSFKYVSEIELKGDIILNSIISRCSYKFDKYCSA